MCEEHRRAHSKTRLTKAHKVTHVRDLLLADEEVALEVVPERTMEVVQERTLEALESTLHSEVVQYPGRKLLTYLVSLVMLVDGVVVSPGRKPLN